MGLDLSTHIVLTELLVRDFFLDFLCKDGLETENKYIPSITMGLCTYVELLDKSGISPLNCVIKVTQSVIDDRWRAHLGLG